MERASSGRIAAAGSAIARPPSSATVGGSSMLSTTGGAGGFVTPTRKHPAVPVFHGYLEERALDETQHSKLLRATRTRAHDELENLLTRPETARDDLDCRGMTALHHAAALGDLEALALIIERDGLRMLEQQDRCGSTPLHHAALLNHPQAVKFLLEKGANINAQKANGRTCLHEAAWIGHMEVLEVLMEAHADPQILEANHRTAEQLARMNHADAAADRVRAYVQKLADDEYKAELERRNREWMSSFARATKLRRDCGKSRKKRSVLTPEEVIAREERRRKREEANQRRKAAEEAIAARAAWLEEQRKRAAGDVDATASRASSVCSYALSDSELSERGLKRGTFVCHCPYCSTWRKLQEKDEWEAHKQAQLG